jgi:hypothetical protein
MIFKYVVLRVEAINQPVKEVAALIPVTCNLIDARWMYSNGQLVSAGLVEFTAENGEVVVNCYDSTDNTLSVKSRKEVDDALMREVFAESQLSLLRNAA